MFGELEANAKEKIYLVDTRIKETQNDYDLVVKKCDQKLEEENQKFQEMTIEYEIRCAELNSKLEEEKAQIKEKQLTLQQKENGLEMQKEKWKTEIETNAKVEILKAIAPGLIEAMNDSKNAAMFTAATENIAPYAMAQNKSISDYINKLFRGTTVESLISKDED